MESRIAVEPKNVLIVRTHYFLSSSFMTLAVCVPETRIFSAMFNLYSYCVKNVIVSSKLLKLVLVQ